MKYLSVNEDVKQYLTTNLHEVTCLMASTLNVFVGSDLFIAHKCLRVIHESTIVAVS